MSTLLQEEEEEEEEEEEAGVAGGEGGDARIKTVCKSSLLDLPFKWTPKRAISHAKQITGSAAHGLQGAGEYNIHIRISHTHTLQQIRTHT